MIHRFFLFKQFGLPFCYLFHVLMLPNGLTEQVSPGSVLSVLGWRWP